MLPQVIRTATSEANYCEDKALVYRHIASLTRESPEYIYALTVLEAMRRYRSLRRTSSNGILGMLARRREYREIERPDDMRARGEKCRVILNILEIDYPNVATSWYYEERRLDRVLLQIVEAQFGSRPHMYVP